MGHNKMFAAYSEYSIGFRPEAALIQHNSRCGGVAVAVSGEWVGRWRSPTRRQRGQTWPEAISTYLTTKAAPPFLTICLSEEWNGASERQADCAQQSVMPEGRAFKFGSTSLHSMHAFMPASFATRQEARREARRSYYLFKMKAPISWDIIRLQLWQQVE